MFSTNSSFSLEGLVSSKRIRHLPLYLLAQSQYTGVKDLYRLDLPYQRGLGQQTFQQNTYSKELPWRGRCEDTHSALAEISLSLCLLPLQEEPGQVRRPAIPKKPNFSFALKRLSLLSPRDNYTLLHICIWGGGGRRRKLCFTFEPVAAFRAAISAIFLSFSAARFSASLTRGLYSFETAWVSE